MPLPIYTSAAFTNGSGVSVASNASVEVRRESDGSLVPIFEDRDGENQITQPGFQADLDGRFEFYAESDAEGWEITVTAGSDTHTLNNQFPQGGVFGIPEGERALHTGTNGGGTPIGGYVTVQTDLTGAEEPDPETHIKLEAGLTGAGGYNEGKLGSESVTGSAPLVVATAQITDAESPMNGQTVHLLETERRFLRAGEAGTVENDQMQRITGDGTAIRLGRTTSGNVDNGAIGIESAGGTDAAAVEGAGNAHVRITFNSANSPNARASSTTGGETRAKNIGVSVFMRIK